MSQSEHGPFNKPVEDWSGIADSELRTRLIHRGIDPLIAKGWVMGRELTQESEQITAALSPNEFDQAQGREREAMKDVARQIIKDT